MQPMGGAASNKSMTQSLERRQFRCLGLAESLNEVGVFRGKGRRENQFVSERNGLNRDCWIVDQTVGLTGRVPLNDPTLFSGDVWIMLA